MRSKVGVVLAVCAAGCATTPPPPAASPTTPAPVAAAAPAPAPPAPLWVFRAESFDRPKLAAAFNQKIEARFPKGAGIEYAAQGLESAMLAVGCLEPTPKCWAALAGSVSAKNVLIPEVGGKKKQVTVRLTPFDREKMQAVHVAEQSALDGPAAVTAAAQVVEKIPAWSGGPAR